MSLKLSTDDENVMDEIDRLLQDKSSDATTVIAMALFLASILAKVDAHDLVTMDALIDEAGRMLKRACRADLNAAGVLLN
jgi:hypothetical protein